MKGVLIPTTGAYTVPIRVHHTPYGYRYRKLTQIDFPHYTFVNRIPCPAPMGGQSILLGYHTKCIPYPMDQMERCKFAIGAIIDGTLD